MTASGRYGFLTETYATEQLKVLGVWSMFEDGDLAVRPHPTDARGRSVLEHMVHQSLSEDLWFRTMLGIDVGAPPLPDTETRTAFLRSYAERSAKRLAALRAEPDEWWEEEVAFFDVRRSRAWVMVRRIAHTAHHRAEMTTLLRLLGRQVHSVYGPSIDTGGLPANNAPTIYAYPDIASLLEGERAGGRKAALPGPGATPSTERPSS